MLQRYSEVFRSLLMASDAALVAAAWLVAYAFRFYGYVDAPLGVPELRPYLELLLVIVPVYALIFRARGLYRPWRAGSLWQELGAVLTANGFGLLALIAVSFFARSYFYSRGVLLLFFGLSCGFLVLSRLVLRGGLRAARSRGFNLRHVLVVGGGPPAEHVIDRLHAHPEAGLRVFGVLGEEGGARERSVRGVPVIGAFGELKEKLAQHRPDLVMIALPPGAGDLMEKLLSDLDDEIVNVKIVPDLPALLTLRARVEDLDGLPLIALREGPLLGWAAVQKRVFDVVVSGLALLLSSPLIALIALMVRLSSGRPIFYVQERMGLDGRVFGMIKFRTMRDQAEGDTGPVWTVQDDPRRTRIGAFLRRTSLDELPQLWNVLRGDMSLVGPRPERPVFIEQFRHEIPGYMLRHKIKAGLTGWAQVHGWRGDTSLHERVEHDLYYLEHWSLALDVWILLMTVWRGLGNRNAY